MAALFTEDLDAFFTDFGDTATVGGADVQVIFDNASQGTQVGILGMAGTQPAITCKTADLAADPVGLAAVVGGTTYTITQHDPDGTGISLCLLEIAA
jgi:hypothetical protein